MPASNETLRWLITGCSSGLGRCLAEAALARGDRVILTARSVDALGDLPARYPSMMSHLQGVMGNIAGLSAVAADCDFPR